MTRRSRVRIDPNIRIGRHMTLVDFADFTEFVDPDGTLAPGEPVTVFEPEADIEGDGVVVGLHADPDRTLVVLTVDWLSLKPVERSASSC